MSEILTGSNGAVLIRTDPEFKHGEGWSLNGTYRGPFGSIVGLTSELINAGYEFDIDSAGPYYDLTARKQAQEGNDQGYTDKFTLSKEAVTKSIWSLEEIDQEMIGYGDAAKYRKTIQDAVDASDDNGFADLELELPEALYPSAHAAFVELSRGAESYEDEYTVLKRDRIVGLLYSQQAVALKNKSVVYPPDQFLAAFDIPSFLQVVLPATPLITPSNTRWGWRIRKQEIEYYEGQTAHIVEDWAFAAWSKNLYDTSLFSDPYPPA